MPHISTHTSTTRVDEPLPAESADLQREPRGARRKRRTRARLLDAALKLMAEKGAEGVAINEITEAADVGFGSFYNHFESKDAIYAALVDGVFEDFADTLERCAAALSDPAEVIAVCVRHALLRAQREPLWGQFLIREGFSARTFSGGLGPRLLRDVQKGIAAGRFSAADPLMSVLCVGGTVLAAIAAQLHVATSTTLANTLASGFAAPGSSSEDFPERVATALLQTLGLAHAEAERIARRPLPAVPVAEKAS